MKYYSIATQWRDFFKAYSSKENEISKRLVLDFKLNKIELPLGLWKCPMCSHTSGVHESEQENLFGNRVRCSACGDQKHFWQGIPNGAIYYLIQNKLIQYPLV